LPKPAAGGQKIMLGALADILKRRGSEGWLVGGSVRDRMMKRFSPDLDAVVSDDAAEVAKQVAAALHSPWFSLSERYPTYRVLGSDGHVDVAAVHGGSILADLAQRDFTMNAMAVPVAELAAAGRANDTSAGLPVGVTVLDPYGGAGDLHKGCLVAVSDDIFTDDPLRLMRAARFCHTLGLRLDDHLGRLVKEQSRRLSGAAAERVVNEMCLTLASGHAAAAARLWDEWGLLSVVLPELMGLGDTSATGALLQCLDEMLERPEDWFPDGTALLRERWGEPVDGTVERPVALRLTALTHPLGVDAVRGVGQRLKLSGALVSLLVAVSRCLGADDRGGAAGRPRVLADLLPDSAQVSREAVLFLWDAAPWQPEVVMLAAAREAAAAGVAKAGEAARRLMALVAERARGGMQPCPVDGEVLMREFNLEGGPLLGRALREARLAWEAGEAKTAAEVLAVARAVVS
jgi:poly(A) polymerase